MSELPMVSGRETVKALGKVGFEVDRQRGTHIIVRSLNRLIEESSYPTTKRSPKVLSVLSSGMPA